MMGSELIKKIEEKGWKDTNIYTLVNGVLSDITSIEPLFPKLSNTTDIVLSNGKEQNSESDEFWRTFYGSYMNILTPEEADRDFKAGNRNFYILYCDGTEAQVDADLSTEEWNTLKETGVWFGYEKN